MYRGYMVHENSHGTPKLWAIAHQNVHKRENDDFLIISLRHLRGIMDHEIARELQKCGQYLIKRP